MSSILDRDPILAELADLRDKVDELQEEVRQLHAAMTPICAFPVSWRLTGMEARLLHALRRAKGGALHRECILVSLYGFEVDVEPKIIDVMVCKMRKKLTPYRIEIKTYWGTGFGLTLESLPIITEAITVAQGAKEPPPLAEAA